MKAILSQQAIENSNTATDTFDAVHITLLTRTDNRPAGKTLSLKDGHLDKQTANHTGIYCAETVTLAGDTPSAILDSYRALVESLTPAQSIILGDAPATGGQTYRILPKKLLAQRLGISLDKAETVGFVMLDGQLTGARLKVNYRPSRLLLCDFDADERMPAEWRDLDESGRWDLFTAAVPEMAGAARLTIPSGSARVLKPDGQPLKAAATAGSHTYIVLNRALSTDELDALRNRLEIRLWTRGLGYFKPTAAGARRRYALFDTTVWVSGRECFDGPPAICAPLALAPLTAQLHDGGFTGILGGFTADDARLYSELTGARVVREKAHGGDGKRKAKQPKGDNADGAESDSGELGAVRFVIEDSTSLRMDTTIITDRGPMTVKAFLESGAPKLRCQATFRESVSWAGILRRIGQTAILHDVGTGTTYRIGSAVEIPGGLSDALKALEAQHPANAQGYARAILFKHAWRCPVQMGYADLLRRIAEAHPAIDRADLELIAQWLKDNKRRTAKRAVTIEPDKLPMSVTYHAGLRTMDEIRTAIERMGAGVHLVKSPHDSGKTEFLLKPIALAHHDVMAISPRISLCADLSNRLKLSNYQTCEAGAPDLAICINSIVNPKHALSVNGARVVLIDEAARVIRECHSPGSTMKKEARATWDKLIDAIGHADLCIGVDADFSTEDVAMFAAALGMPVHLWVIAEAAREKHAAFIHEDQLLAELHSAVAAGERVMFIADSAKAVAGQAAALRAAHPDKKIVAIHQSKGIATAGSAEIRALLSDINGDGLAAIDVLLMSPAVESGVSLNKKHFTRHFALYHGVNEPAQFNQQLLRDRTATHWRIALNGNGFKQLPESMGEILNNLGAAQRRVMALADDPTQFTFAPATQFDVDCCKVIAAGNEAKNSYGAHLWFILEHRGWAVERGQSSAAPDDGRAIKSEAKAALIDEKQTAILNAQDKREDEVKAIREAYAVTAEQSAIVARFDTRAANAKPTGEIDAADVELWADGRLESQNRLFDDLTAAAGVSHRDLSDAEAGVSPALRSYDAARGEAIRAFVVALGIDPETGEGIITDAGVRAAFSRLKGTDTAKVLEHFGIAQFRALGGYAIRWASTALKKLGLWLEGHGHDVRGYRIALGVKRSKKGHFELPGWRLMCEIRDRHRDLARRCAYNILNTASASQSSARAAA